MEELYNMMLHSSKILLMGIWMFMTYGILVYVSSRIWHRGKAAEEKRFFNMLIAEAEENTKEKEETDGKTAAKGSN